MQQAQLEELARLLQAGDLSTDEFLQRWSAGAVAHLEEAQVDLDRQRRCGYPEVVFGQGKTAEGIERIFHSLLESGVEPFATRVDAAQAEHLLKKFPSGAYNGIGRTFRVSVDGQTTANTAAGRVAIITAGTSDRPVAEEAKETALWMGAEITFIQDAGVAGPQRLLAHVPTLRSADAVVVIAGMEGALPSVVGGHVDCPVVAVPTSVGYGASFGGLAALLGMLNSCASNVTVVNIDAGFKGAYVAGIIARQAAAGRRAAGDTT